MKLSEMIHIAADEHLNTTSKMSWPSFPISRDVAELFHNSYSCLAFKQALGSHTKTYIDWDFYWNRFKSLCINVGLDPENEAAFADVPRKVRQQYRYAWLKFLALLAEEQGL